MTLDRWMGIEKEKKDLYKDIAGKPLGVRRLVDLCPGWKPDIFGLGEHYRLLKPSKEVQLSSYMRMFIECIEKIGPADGEEIWNEYYAMTRFEVGPKTFKKWMNKLITAGLVERIDNI